MAFDPKIHHRKSIRLNWYDYSQAGAYFVTICTHDRTLLFGKIVDGEILLNEYGIIVKNEWLRTEKLRVNVMLDEYVIMPNHIHGIIIITNEYVGHAQRAPTNQFAKPVSNSLPTIIRMFKSTTARQIRQIHPITSIPVWQRNYYEHIAHDDDDLNSIRQYIIDNPLQWQFDKENPDCIKLPKKMKYQAIP